MSPLKHSNNLAARMGRWSAGHWKTAVFGWLALVAASVYIGGQSARSTSRTPTSPSARPARPPQLVEAGFPKAADEQSEIVLIQSKTLTADDPAFKATVEDVAEDARGEPEVTKLHAPHDAGHADLVSDDRHSAQVSTSRSAPSRRRPSTSTRSMRQSTRPQAAHAGFAVSQLGSVTTTKATDAAFNSMLAKAAMIALPLTLIILLLVFGSQSSALIPLLLAVSAVFATTALMAIPSQFIAVTSRSVRSSF